MTYLNFKATHVNMNVLRTGTAPGIGVKDGEMGTSASKFKGTVQSIQEFLNPCQGV